MSSLDVFCVPELPSYTQDINGRAIKIGDVCRFTKRAATFGRFGIVQIVEVPNNSEVDVAIVLESSFRPYYKVRTPKMRSAMRRDNITQIAAHQGIFEIVDNITINDGED